MFFTLCPFYILCAKGWISSADAFSMLAVSHSLVERGAIDVPPATPGAYPGQDGRTYSKYPIGKSIANVPGLVACKALARAPQGRYPEERVCGFTSSLLNPVLTALTCASLFALLLSLSFTARESLLLTLAYGLATIAFPYAKDDMNEPLAALLLLAAVSGARAYLAGASFPPLWATATLLGALAATRYEMIPLVGVMAVIVAASPGERRTSDPRAFWRDAAWASTVLALIAAAVAAYNYRRFGSVLSTGYRVSSTESWEGFAGDATTWLSRGAALLVSPSRGMFFYMPFLILAPVGFVALCRQSRRDALLCAAPFLTQFVIVSGFNSWAGGWSWGPRYLLPVLALMIPSVGFALRRPLMQTPAGKGLAWALVIVSVLIQISAVVVPWRRYLTELAVREAAGEPIVSTWSLRDAQPIAQWGQWAAVFGPGAAPWRALSYDTHLADSSPAAALTRSRGLNVPEFWFVHVYYWGVPVVLIVMAMAFLVAAMGMAARSLKASL